LRANLSILRDRSADTERRTDSLWSALNARQGSCTRCNARRTEHIRDITRIYGPERPLRHQVHARALFGLNTYLLSSQQIPMWIPNRS
jgi:hypothetical protein